MAGVGVCGAIVGGAAVGDAVDVGASAWDATIGSAARASLEPAPAAVSRGASVGTGVAV
jgi:hypothetical protein